MSLFAKSVVSVMSTFSHSRRQLCPPAHHARASMWRVCWDDQRFTSREVAGISPIARAPAKAVRSVRRRVLKRSQILLRGRVKRALQRRQAAPRPKARPLLQAQPTRRRAFDLILYTASICALVRLLCPELSRDTEDRTQPTPRVTFAISWFLLYN